MTVGAVFIVYFFTNPIPQNQFDYTFRVAESLLGGSVAIDKMEMSWLNELVPFEGYWYSVFPLGSVITMIPAAIFKRLGVINEMPGRLIAALTATVICLFLSLIAENYNLKAGKKRLLIFAILFGTWMWMNLTVAGAWQLALGFAMLGQTAAIYYTIYKPRPLIAGVFFALAFGNRTEILLVAPIFIFLLIRSLKNRNSSQENFNSESENFNLYSAARQLFKYKKQIIAFCIFPVILGTSTLIYNYVRFHSFFDFGYARIPDVLEESWYRHGIFSLYYIPRQAYEMLFKSWIEIEKFPYLAPDDFSSSILISSPFLFLLLRFGACDRIIKYSAWAAIFILTFLLWIHGNSGGYQFGYRYAIILLPWIFLLLLENSPRKITNTETVLYFASFLLNAYSIVYFHWQTH